MKIVKYMIVIAVVAGGVVFALKRRQSNATEEAPLFSTAKVQRTNLRMTVSGSGVLEPLTTVDVKANVAGEIIKLPVDTGDQVKAGELLAVIDPTEIESNYRQAQADVQAATARVEEAQVNKVLQDKTTPLRVTLAEEALRAAEAKEAQSRRNLELERQTSAAQIRQAEEALAAAQSRLKSTQKSAAVQPSLTQSSVRQAEANLKAAQEAVAELKTASHPRVRKQIAASLQQAEANLEQAKLDLKRQQELLAKGFVPKQAVDDAATAVAKAQAAVDSARAEADALSAQQQAELRTAEAKVAQMTAALTAAKANEVQVELAAEEVESSRAGVKQAEASLALARANAAQIELREADLAAAQAAVAQARENLKLAQADALQSEVRRYQVQQAEAQTVRSRAQLDNARESLDDTVIYAPRDGVIVERYVEEGSIITSGRSSITQGTNIVTIADITEMFVLADVDEVDVGYVREGQRVELTVETFPEELFMGTVTKVYPKGVDKQNVTVFPVKIALAYTDPRLRPGMTAEAVIVTAEKKGVLAVPNSALSQRGDKQSVEVVVNGEPQPREVETGLATFEDTEILSGLKEGEEIVTLRARTSSGPWADGGKSGGKGGGKGQGNSDGKSSKGEEAQRNMRRMMRSMSSHR